jgi:hypothetical protein
MSLPFKPKLTNKSILTFDGFTHRIKEIGSTFKDKRRGKNKQYNMQDIVLSAFSVFYLQCPSFLSYQEAMESEQGNNNARTLFGIEKIPSDNHIRDLLDIEDPKTLFPIFSDVFHGLEEAHLLDGLRGSLKNLLFAFDGVEYHRSNTIHCDQCKVFEHSNGTKSYAHSMVTAVIVKPGCPHVIDLEPEFIVPQDGHDKQDSEHAAIKRWLTTYAKHYEKYGVTILGDDLYACQPVCKLVKDEKLHFIFTCKQSSHKTLYENIEGLRKTDLLEVVEVSRWTGKRREYDKYSFSNELDLRSGEDPLKVNWCELTTTDAKGNVLYYNAFITDHKIHRDNVAAIVEDGRARWKTENENNNTLKKHGYNLDHNFGHGDENLSNILVTFNLLAFLCHTVLAMTSEAYQKIRKKLGARKKFFEHIRTLTHYILFDSWESLLCFMMKKLKLPLNTT